MKEVNHSINKQIYQLAIPNIITNVSVPLLSSVDTALMGHLSITHLGAIGLSSMIFNFLYWNFGFLRMGTTGLTAQAFGRNDSKAIYSQLFKAFSLALVLALLLITFQTHLLSGALILLNVSLEAVPYVSEYFYLRILAAPATLGLYGILGWYFGQQNAKIPLVITVVINLVNILFSWYMVVQLNMGIRGAALGTVIAQYSGLLLALVILFYRSGVEIRSSMLSLEWKLEEYLEFLSLNKDIFIRTFFLSLAFAFFSAQSSKYGEMVLAANVIYLQFINWMSYGIDGLAFATESIIGKYKGRKEWKQLDEVLKIVFIWGAIFAVVYSLIYVLFGSHLFNVFSDQEFPIDLKNKVILWAVIAPLLGFASYIWDGIFVGLTASKSMRNSMILAFVLYFGFHFFLVSVWNPIDGMLLALNLFLISRAVFQWLIFRKKSWMIK